MKNHGNCELCKRDKELTFHHLIPKTCHSNKWFKKNYDLKELQKGILVCRECHDAIHKFIEEKDMARNFNTIEKLMEHEKVAGFVKWISKR